MNIIKSRKRQFSVIIVITIAYLCLQTTVILLNDTKLSRYFWLEHKGVPELIESGKPEHSEYRTIFKAISDQHFWLFRLGLLTAIIIAVYYYDRDEKRYRLFKNISLSTIFILIISSGIITWAFKIIIGKPRPYTKLVEYNPLSLSSKYHSFPSGHTTETISYIVPYIYFFKNYTIWIILPVIAGLLCFLRIILSYHYFSDVLFGIYITAITGYLICYFFEKFKKSS